MPGGVSTQLVVVVHVDDHFEITFQRPGDDLVDRSEQPRPNLERRALLACRDQATGSRTVSNPASRITPRRSRSPTTRRSAPGNASSALPMLMLRRTTPPYGRQPESTDRRNSTASAGDRHADRARPRRPGHRCSVLSFGAGSAHPEAAQDSLFPAPSWCAGGSTRRCSPPGGTRRERSAIHNPGAYQSDRARSSCSRRALVELLSLADPSHRRNARRRHRGTGCIRSI